MFQNVDYNIFYVLSCLIPLQKTAFGDETGSVTLLLHESNVKKFIYMYQLD